MCMPRFNAGAQSMTLFPSIGSFTGSEQEAFWQVSLNGYLMFSSSRPRVLTMPGTAQPGVKH